MDRALPGLRGKLGAQTDVRQPGVVLDVRPQDRVIVLGERGGERGDERLVRLAPPEEVGLARSSPRTDPSETIAGVSRSAISSKTASSRAPCRSILFTKSSVGTRAAERSHQHRVCACTPSTAESTSTAPSSTLSTRSTSAMKSG